MTYLLKYAGLLDTPKDTLPQDIWDTTTMKVLPHIRESIFKNLYSFMPLDNIAEVFIIGSVTGYKYKETSDIDVNVNVFSDADEWSSKIDLYNGKLAEGTQRPVNFFIKQWYRPASPKSWADYIYGAYDLIRNDWIKMPPMASSIRNPQEEFRQELEIARMVSRNFLRETEELRKDLDSYQKLKAMEYYPGIDNAIIRKRREIEEDIKDLISQAQTIKTKRKEEYKHGFGIPRKSFNNIVFKLIEHGQYGELFEALKSIKEDEVEEAKKSLF